MDDREFLSFFAFNNILLTKFNRNNSVSSTRTGIHLSCSNRSIFASLDHFFFDGLIGINIVFGKSLHINSQGFVLSDFEALLCSFADRDEKILHFFVVDLKHRNINFILFIGIFVF